MRSAFSTRAREQTDIAHEVIEAALAHSGGSAVVRAYARTTFFDRRRELPAAWAEFLGSAKVKAIGVGGLTAMGSVSEQHPPS
jgi:hypothetical protein